MEVLIIGSIAPILLIYLKTAFADRCTIDNQLFPSPPLPPPEFPDFMSAFGGTLLRIGIENLWPLQERESCPHSVNWSTFNSRLCGSDPFDLDSFCRTLSMMTSEPSTVVAGPTTPVVVTPENRSATDAEENRVYAVTTVNTREVRSTEDHDGVFLIGNTTEEEPPSFQSGGAASDSHFPTVLPSIRPDYAVSQSPPPSSSPPPPLSPSQMSSLASPVDSSSFAASGALTGVGGDADVAIGVTCGLAVLVVCVIVFVIHFSRHRLCKCREARRSVFKIFIQRQRSDVQPLSTPSPSSHPSTPLQAMYSNPMTTNNNVAEISDVEASRCLPTVH